MAISGGFWISLTFLSVIVFGTALYGLIFHRRTWLKLPKKRSASAVGAGAAVAAFFVSVVAVGITHPIPAEPAHVVGTVAPAATHAPKITPTPTPVVTTKEVSTTSPIPFTTSTVDDPNLPKGTTNITTVGADGVLTTTFEVTLTDGVETGRKQLSQVVTTQPITQITTVGTYVAPANPPAPPANSGSGGTSDIHRGEFCPKDMHGQTVGGLTCKPVVSASGRTYWRWE